MKFKKAEAYSHIPAHSQMRAPFATQKSVSLSVSAVDKDVFKRLCQTLYISLSLSKLEISPKKKKFFGFHNF